MSRIKGTQLIGVVKALRAQREFAIKLSAPHLLPYLEQRVLAELNAGYFGGTLQAAGAATWRVDVITCDSNSAHWRLSWA